jgi:hypothetical protein
VGTSILSLGPDAQRQIAEQLRGQPEAAVVGKYRNRRTAYKSVQGFERAYDSALEARQAALYDYGIERGLIKLWLPQVPFPLPGGVTYRADFMLVLADGRVKFIDCKGRDTQASINKRKQVFALFGVEVEIVRKP